MASEYEKVKEAKNDLPRIPLSTLSRRGQGQLGPQILCVMSGIGMYNYLLSFYHVQLILECISPTFIICYHIDLGIKYNLYTIIKKDKVS